MFAETVVAFNIEPREASAAVLGCVMTNATKGEGRQVDQGYRRWGLGSSMPSSAFAGRPLEIS